MPASETTKETYGERGWRLLVLFLLALFLLVLFLLFSPPRIK